MTAFLRFSDLKARNLFNNWPTLNERIKRDGFPPGRLIGPNMRAWTEEEVADWLATRPTARKAPRGAAKAKAEAKAATA
jgi:hypothetical protein